MNQSNKALRDNHRPLCNCDGSWHVSIKDKDGDWVSHYVDISPVTNHIKGALPRAEIELVEFRTRADGWIDEVGIEPSDQDTAELIQLATAIRSECLREVQQLLEEVSNG